MRHRKGLLFILVTALSTFLVACGASGSESVNLSQTLTYDDGMDSTVSVDYPEGWSATEENGSGSFASSEELLEQAASSDLPDVASGEVVAVSLALPSDMASMFMEEGTDPSPASLANSFVSDIVSEGDEIGEVEETTINDQAAAVVQGTTENISIVLVTIELGDGNYALVFGATAEGEGDDIRATIEAMAGSISIESTDSE